MFVATSCWFQLITFQFNFKLALKENSLDKQKDMDHTFCFTIRCGTPKWNNHVVFRPIIRWYDIEAKSDLIQKLWKRLNKKNLWNLGTEVNHSEMKEIKSVKLRDNLKIHQRQTGHIVISIQMMRHLFLAVANIISEHRSIRKKIL